MTLQELAAYVCHYGGSSYQTLVDLEEANLAEYRKTADINCLGRARKISVLLQMMSDGVEFIEYEAASTFYYMPKTGWTLLEQYLHRDVL